MATITDTGTTARQFRSGEWVEVPVVIRDGRTCACGDLHGIFPKCIGSDADATAPSPRPRRQRADRPKPTVSEFFPFPNRRLPRAIPQPVINACADCGPQHEAFYYCKAHRSQAIRNTILASRTRPGIISLHMMMAENGLDIVS